MNICANSKRFCLFLFLFLILHFRFCFISHFIAKVHLWIYIIAINNVKYIVKISFFLFLLVTCICLTYEVGMGLKVGLTWGAQQEAYVPKVGHKNCASSVGIPLLRANQAPEINPALPLLGEGNNCYLGGRSPCHIYVCIYESFRTMSVLKRGLTGFKSEFSFS